MANFKKLLKVFAINVLPIILVFCASLYNSADLDLGWHLRYGEYFLKNHTVLYENNFTSTMVGYPYPNTSWATDILTYSIFTKFGFFGLAIFGAFVIALTFFFLSKAANLSLWDQAFILPLIIYLEEPVNAASFRAQQLSFLLLAVLLYLLSLFQAGQKKALFWVIPLFLLWVSLHGEYLTGLVILFGWVFFHLLGVYLQEKKKVKKVQSAARWLVPVSLAAVLVTLINPFGLEIYRESVRHFGNPLQKYIIEWQPISQGSNLWWNHLVFAVLVLLGVNILIRQKKLWSILPVAALVVPLFFLPFWMRRYAWILYYLSFPLLLPITSILKPKNPKTFRVILIFMLVTWSFFAVRGKFPLDGFTQMNWETYCRFYTDCSPKAAQFIIDNKLTENLYTFYDWGGWMEWNYREIKPSMDGRMALWMDQDGYSAFREYYALEQGLTDINKTSYQVVLIPPRKPLYRMMLLNVSEKKWKLLYKDNFAAVFVRNASKAN